MFGNYLHRTTSADDIFRCIFSWRFKGLNVDKKKYVGHDVRKTLFGGLRTTKAQTSLRFRSDLEITQTSPNKAVGGSTAMTLFRPKRF